MYKPHFRTRKSGPMTAGFHSHLAQVAETRERAGQSILCTQERMEPGVAGRRPVATATIGGGNPGRRCGGGGGSGHPRPLPPPQWDSSLWDETPRGQGARENEHWRTKRGNERASLQGIQVSFSPLPSFCTPLLLFLPSLSLSSCPLYAFHTLPFLVFLPPFLLILLPSPPLSSLILYSHLQTPRNCWWLRVPYLPVCPPEGLKYRKPWCVCCVRRLDSISRRRESYWTTSTASPTW